MPGLELALVVLAIIDCVSFSEGKVVSYYVSPTGDDAAAGDTPSAAWQTLHYAQIRAREAQAQQPIGAPAVTTYLLDGVYRLNSTWTFNAADSNTVWLAAPHANPLVTGSIAVSWGLFKPATDPRLPSHLAGKVYKLKLADIPGSNRLSFGKGLAGWDYRNTDRLQVFFGPRDAAPLTLARYPNVGDKVQGSEFVSYATGSDGYVLPRNAPSGEAEGGKQKADAFSFGGAPLAVGMGNRPQHWAATGGAPQLAVHGAWRFEWADQMMSVTHVNLTNESFSFDGARTNLLRYWPPMAGCPYYVLDLLQELDSPGEWWLDRSTGELFVYPPTAPADSTAPNSTAIELSVELPTPTNGVGPAAKAVLERSGPTLLLLENVAHLTLSGAPLLAC
eukprot:SAG11_NODE_4857_length_1745_cov_1.350547_2_plen_390_part_00